MFLTQQNSFMKISIFKMLFVLVLSMVYLPSFAIDDDVGWQDHHQESAIDQQISDDANIDKEKKMMFEYWNPDKPLYPVPKNDNNFGDLCSMQNVGYCYENTWIR